MAVRLIFFKYTSYSNSQTLGFEDEYQYLFNVTIMPATYKSLVSLQGSDQVHSLCQDTPAYVPSWKMF